MCCAAPGASLRRSANSGTTCASSIPRAKGRSMFAPRTVQPHPRVQAPVQTRPTADAPTPGSTPTEPVRGSEPFLQRYLGNSDLQSLSTESKALQEAAVPPVIHDGSNALHDQQTGEVQTKSTADQTTGSGLATGSQHAVEIDGMSLTTYADAAAWYQGHIVKLDEQQTEM